MSKLDSQENSFLSESNKLIPGLYKLVSGINKASTTASSLSSDLLQQLDQNDTNELTTKLKDKLTKALGPLVEKELENRDSDFISKTDPGIIVNSISENILESQSYTDLYNSLSANLKQATNSVIEEMELHSREGSLNNYLSIDTQTSESISLNLQFACMPYISSNYLKELINKFDTTNSSGARREALRAIVQFSPSEILSCPDWPTLHVLVTRSLGDQDPFISNNSFGILLRLFSTSNLTAIKESYVILVEHLLDTPYYNQEVKQGVDVCSVENTGLMQKFHLLTIFIYRLPHYWFRFNNAFMSEIIDITLDLLMLRIDHNSLVTFSNSNSISPIYYLSLIDHNAGWIQRLLHAEYSRQFIVQKLESNPAFLRTIVEYTLVFARLFKQNTNNMNEIENPMHYYYNEDSLNYLLFIASLNIMQNVIIYEIRHLIFPQKFDGEYFKDKNTAAIYYITTLIDRLYDGNNCIDKEFDPFYVILETLTKALQKGRISDKIFVDGRIISSLMRTVINKEQLITSLFDTNSHISYVYDVISKLTESDMGRNHFMSSENATHLTELVTHTKALLQSIPAVTAAKMIRLILTPVINLLSSPGGKLHQDPFEITNFLSDQLKNKVLLQNSSNRYELLDLMVNLTAVPRGILTLKKYNILDECIEVLFMNNEVNLNSFKTSSVRYGYLLSQLSNFNCSKVAVQHTNLLRYLADTLNNVMNRTDESLLYKQASLIAPLNRNVHKSLYNISKVIVNYPILLEMLDSSTTIQSLMQYVLVKSNERINDISNFEEIHVISLGLLNQMLCSLDNFLLLESMLGISSVLISLQNDTVVINEAQVLDQLSYERNRVLLKIGIIGGPNEKMHLENSLHCYEEIDKSKLISCNSFPLPKSYGYFNKRVPWLPDEAKEFPTTIHELQNWFTKQMTSNDKTETLKHFQVLLHHLMCRTFENSFPKPTANFDTSIKSNMTRSEEIAIRLLIQYGCNLELLKDEEKDTKQFILLLANIKHILLNQQYTSLQENTLRTLHIDSYCFDWFIGIIFIIMRGEAQKTYTLLTAFSTQLSSIYIWINRIHKSKLLPYEIVMTGCNWALTNILHNLEYILKTEIPSVHTALHVSGVSIGTVCCVWIQQCFLNYLDVEEVCGYILTVLVMGLEYQIYYIICILKHLQEDILEYTQENNLLYYLLENPIRGFLVRDWIQHMKELEKKWEGCIDLSLPD